MHPYIYLILYFHVILFCYHAPPRSGPPKDPDPPCFNLSTLSELIFLNRDNTTNQQYPKIIATTKGPSPMVLSTGYSGVWGGMRGGGMMNRKRDSEKKQQMLMKYIISHGMRTHRVQQAPPVHIITSNRLAKIEYLQMIIWLILI